ncbi:MAG: sulfatase [Thermoanaerobaculia bacterium]
MCYARRLAALGFALATASSCAVPRAPVPLDRHLDEGRPNFLLVLLDDQRFDAMSNMGHPWLETPHIDRLAAEGARFEHAFVTTSLCSPSRASFLTGRHVHSHGVTRNESGNLSHEVVTYPKLLRQAGYQTAWLGKWHMGWVTKPQPGFDYWLSFPGHGTYTDPDLIEGTRQYRAQGYLTDLLVDHAIGWLEEWSRTGADQPFCLVLSHKAVHAPFEPAPRHAGRYANKTLPQPKSFTDDLSAKPEVLRRMVRYGQLTEDYEAHQDEPVPPTLPSREWNPRSRPWLAYHEALLAVDEGLGRILAVLEELGVSDDTMIIYTSDNGFLMGAHGLGDKRLAYEESMRIPFLVRYPRAVKAGERIDPMILNIDLAPTLLDYAGAEIPEGMQGRSLRPLLEGRPPDDWRSHFFYAYYRENWVKGIPTTLAVRTERWKYIVYPEVAAANEELYDLREDPIEMNNLAEEAELVEELAAMRELLEESKVRTHWAMPELGSP